MQRKIRGVPWYGFSAFEQVWRIENGWVKWARWTPLLPRTIWRWWVGDDNALVGVQQWTFKQHSSQFVDIPARKLITFHRRMEGQNYESVSLLRSAYKHWFYKVQFEKVESVGIERNAVIPPVISLPEGFTSDDVLQAQAIGANIRANMQMAVTLPPGWSLEYPRNFQHGAVQVQQSIQYHLVLIARNALCQFINLGATETGAYALDESQRRDLLENLQAVCAYIEGVINSGPIRQLVGGLQLFRRGGVSQAALRQDRRAGHRKAGRRAEQAGKCGPAISRRRDGRRPAGERRSAQSATRHHHGVQPDRPGERQPSGQRRTPRPQRRRAA